MKEVLGNQNDTDIPVLVASRNGHIRPLNRHRLQDRLVLLFILALSNSAHSLVKLIFFVQASCREGTAFFWL